MGKRRGPPPKHLSEDQKGQTILRLSYQKGMSMRKIGNILGISRERVRQIYKKKTGLTWTEIKNMKKMT
ncbi:sigma factor-like helix-turn-helix DNA-binding protein [Candidatus Margulisiibacteriota bacterium]